MTNLDSIFKSRDITFPTKFHLVKAMVFPVGKKKDLDCEESWVLKNWCFWTVVLEKTLESLLDCKEIQPVHSEGDEPWVFIGRTDAKAETPILWPPHVKSWLIGKDPHAGRNWGQEEKGTTGWDGWMASPTWFTWVWVNSSVLMDREAWHAVIHGVAKSLTRLRDWIELIYCLAQELFYYVVVVFCCYLIYQK